MTTSQSASLVRKDRLKRGSFHPETKAPPMGGAEAPTAKSGFFTDIRNDSSVLARLLLVDLGGSSLKAGLYQLDGQVLGLVRVANQFDEDATGRAEQNPVDWWQALQSAADQLAQTIAGGLSGVIAVVICGFTRSQVFLDSRGQPVRAAITFRDARAQSQVHKALMRLGDADHPSARYFNAFHPLARLLWLQEHEQAHWCAITHVIEPKDYLNLKLIGAIFSDPISQFWLLDVMAHGAPSFASRVGVASNLLPPLRQPQDAIGRVQAGLPGALGQIQGAQVFCGAPDTWMAAAGLGAIKHGGCYGISGSSEVFGIVADHPAQAQGLITIPWAKGLWQLGGPGQNGANVLDWMVNHLDASTQSFDEKLARLLTLQTRQPLLFHPFLHGERTPFWDQNLRACLLGLTAAHQPGDQIRAVMEGITFVNRLVLNRAETASGQNVAEIRLAGGGARNAFWNQIRANILNRPVLVAQSPEMGLMGCLAVARLGLGQRQDIPAVADTFERYQPQRHQVDIYDQLYQLFLSSFPAVEQVSHRLAEMTQTIHHRS